VDETSAESVGLISDYEGDRYYFCSTECKDKFDAGPLFADQENLRRESFDEGYTSAGE
jgi:YHS domain-containing protein